MMRQFFAIGFLLTYFFPVFSQEETVAKEKTGFGIYFSPEVNGLIIQDKSPHLSVQPKVGVSVGAEMNFTFGEHFVLRAGFGFGFKQVRHINNNYVFTQYFHPQDGAVVTAIYETKFQELQFPVSFHYKFSERFFIGVGTEFIIPNYFPAYWYIDNHPGIDSKKRPFGLVTDYRDIALSVSMGYRFKLARSFYLLLEPTFRFYLREIRLDLNTDSHFYSAGLKTTVWLGGK